MGRAGDLNPVAHLVGQPLARVLPEEAGRRLQAAVSIPSPTYRRTVLARVIEEIRSKYPEYFQKEK